MKKDWIEVEFGELSLLELGGDWGKDPSIEDDDYIEAYCIRGSEFRNWEANKGKTASLRKIKKDSIEKRNLLLDDILVEISGGGPEQPVGRTVLIEQSVLNHFKDKNLVCTNFLRLIRPSGFVNSTYLNHYLKYFYSTGKIIRYQSGSNNLRNLKFNDYLTIEIPFAPLPIQRAIVSKIEALFSDLDNGIANFKKAQEQLKIYRQAVLKKAFEGELTKEWREKQTYLSTAEELLKQIKEERQNHYNQQIEDWKKAVKEREKKGKVDDKPRKPLLPKDFPPLKDDDLNILPKAWKWVNWNDILDYNDGAFKRGPFGSSLTKSIFVESGYKVYEQYCPINDDCSFERYYITAEKFKELNSFSVKQGDFLISCSGVTLGRITQVPEKFKEGVINQALLRLRINKDFIDDKFFKFYFRSPFFQKQIFDNSTGSAIPNIKGVNELKVIPVPLLTKAEQNQIIQEIEFRLSVCDKMEQSLSESIEKAEALRQSILKKAFEGNLLSQAEIEQCKKEADYEPASELLKKIASAKLSKSKAEKGTRVTNEKLITTKKKSQK